MNKLLFVRLFEYFPFNIYMPSYGSLSVLGSIEKEFPEIEVSYFDMCIPENNIDNLKILIKKYNPDIIMFSLTYIERDLLFTLCKFVKKKYSDIITVAGGIGVTCSPQQFAKNKNIDYSISGEGELRAVNLIKHLKNSNIKLMDGISYLKNNKPYVSKTTSYIKNLDNLFIPSWKYNDFKTYSNLPSLTTYKNTPYAPVSTSRGCPYKCPFCNNRYQPPYRARSINHVKKELDYLKKIGVKEIVFTDDIFNFPEKRAQDLLKMIIRRKYGFSLSFMGIRLDIINSKTLDLMKQAGAYFFQFGVQNTSTNIEKKIGRNIKNGKMKLIHNNRYAKKIGITTNAQFIYGFPEENYNDYYSNLIFSKILGSDFVCFFKLTPYPGTEYAEKIKNIEKIPSKDFNFNSKNEKLNLSRISCKNTVKFVNLSYKKFFLHKLKIIKTFLKIPKNRYFLKTTFYEYINYLNNIGLIKSFKKNILKNKKQAFQGKQEL